MVRIEVSEDTRDMLSRLKNEKKLINFDDTIKYLLKKEPFFGVIQLITGEIDTFLISFNRCKIGINGGIGRYVWSDLPFYINPCTRSDFPFNICKIIVLIPQGSIGKDGQFASGGRRVDPGQFATLGDPEIICQ